MNKTTLRAGAAGVVSALVFAGGAQAAVVLDWTDTETGGGFAQTVNFDGSETGVTIADLTAKIVYTLNGVSADHKHWTFGYSLANTSAAPVTTSRASGFGFDVGPDVASASVTGTFTHTASGNVPNGIGHREVCFSRVNCAGGASGGVTFGHTGTGDFTLNFVSAQTKMELSDLYVRWQSINTKQKAVGENSSGTGEPTEPTGGAVPEPATWAMMIAGFGLVGVAMRRRSAVRAAA